LVKGSKATSDKRGATRYVEFLVDIGAMEFYGALADK
jgi:hypothetical protein